MPSSLILVCDDAGFASVERGIRTLVERTQAPVCAEYLIEQAGAVNRAKAMSALPLVSIGLHFELSGISDADRVKMSKDLAKSGSSLGEQKEIQEKAKIDARRQLEVFRDALGTNPAHVSTHGNFNADVNDVMLPWWIEFMNELFEGDVPPMQLQHPHVRHNLYSWNLPEKARPPRTPEEFSQELLKVKESDIVEFVMHPALPEPGDASLEMLFTAEMRVRDLESAIDIIRSGAIEKSGFEIVAVSS